MSRFLSLTVFFTLLSSPVFAWDCNYWSQSTNPSAECYKPPQAGVSQTQAAKGGKANAKSKSKSSSQSSSSATGTASAISGDSAASATNAGVTTEFNDSSSVPRQTAPAFSGYVEPTTSCANARNGGASSPIAGLSLGFSTKDKECDLRETARLFFEMGQPELAVALLCKSKAAEKLGDTCKFTSQNYDTRPEYPPGERERRMRDRGFPGFK